MIDDDARLRALLGGPDTSWLIQRIRRRLESGQPVDGVVTLAKPTDAQREAVARLFGRRGAGGATLAVRLSELDGVLRRAELCDGVADAVTRLYGPVTNLRARRERIGDEWRSVFDDVSERVGVRPALQEWLDEIRSTGLLRRLARGEAPIGRLLLDHSLSVADRLPAPGIPLAELAAAATGDSHALDMGRPVGTLVLRVARALTAEKSVETPSIRRDLWANVGVLCDELSAPVLTLNLRSGGPSPIRQALAAHAEQGEPYRVSTRQLLRGTPDFSTSLAGRTVHVCENPTVVAAAANQLGARSAPLVCVEGQMKTAARLLLSQLAAAGVRLMYHGDFDWGGIRIANVVIAACGAVPWRYSAPYYAAAPRGTALRGAPVDACWDAGLAALMRASGHAVHEEQVLAELLTDLADRERMA